MMSSENRASMAAYMFMSLEFKVRRIDAHRRGEVDILVHFLESLSDLEVTRRRFLQLQDPV